MIRILVSCMWKSLLRDRLALMLTFALPCIMFSVFAVIFGGGPGGNGSARTQKLRVILLDQDQSRASIRIAESLRGMDQVELQDYKPPKASGDSDSSSAVSETPVEPRISVARLIRTGKADAAVVFPAGTEEGIAKFGQDRPAIEIIHDPANPLAEQMLAGVLQGAAFTSVPDVLIEQGLKQFEQFGGPMTAMQSIAVGLLKKQLAPEDNSPPATAAPSDTEVSAKSNPADTSPGSALSMNNGIVKITTTSARDIGGPDDPAKGLARSGAMISYYAAGISVMFLMFSMSGAASTLLEHEENGTLERLLSGRLTIFGLLSAHWLFYVLMGISQIAGMFVFASVVFRLDLWHGPTLVGCAAMSVVTAMASAAFIIMLASFCRSRRQLEGISSIVILIMSAFGGSMVPRFVMPTFVQQMSKLTFNGWALDGFLKVFWYNVPGESILLSIAPELGVILLWTAAFLGIAVWQARRWSVA